MKAAKERIMSSEYKKNDGLSKICMSLQWVIIACILSGFGCVHVHKLFQISAHYKNSDNCSTLNSENILCITAVNTYACWLL